MLNKNAILAEESIKLIIGAALTFLLIFVLVTILSPKFDIYEETAKSYRDNLEEALDAADGGKLVEFRLLDLQDESEFYLIYFGGKFLINLQEEMSFSSTGEDGRLCICYALRDEESGGVKRTDCGQCVTSKNEFYMVGEENEWFVPEGQKLNIKFEEERYVFEKI